MFYAYTCNIPKLENKKAKGNMTIYLRQYNLSMERQMVTEDPFLKKNTLQVDSKESFFHENT